ncbi:unnamed protein product [Prorocentrum cordatum]|uniref:(d)CMP kinase n=1 Tax=Prorocentrum cordatum TaxID=2364126 RepID=A0ABN9XYW6_9DINO|nr:unnamed protein product [Polarella glacialis]|mmetsp:Transcript_13594/g.36201  ORF Transcript_13594/g.36201 Transcript_13594/m.36201 type:complete len:395 (-) Transcript_13594:375-1559(-)
MGAGAGAMPGDNLQAALEKVDDSDLKAALGELNAEAKARLLAALAVNQSPPPPQDPDEEAKQACLEALNMQMQQEAADIQAVCGAILGTKRTALTVELLKAMNDKTSGGVIDLLKGNPVFTDLAKKEFDGIVARDNEDAAKLAAGVQQAIEKGVLPKDKEPPTYENVDVLGKTSSQVADEILAKLPKEGGCVMILCGLSGTGKGTTVDTIKAKVPNASTWSNGNCFRSLTLLAATHCEQQGMEFDPAVLTPENLASWTAMLEFDKFDGKFDIRINGLGINEKVSDIANTLLKEPKVSKNIPTVAKETQGEVVKFAGDACKKMGDDGTLVLVEGREQTLNFIESPYRFCLTMSDTSVIGERRAAQRIAAHAAKNVKEGDDVASAVVASLAEIAAQ